MKQTKRGTRRIVGYVVSLTGKRGGPYAVPGTEDESKVLDDFDKLTCRSTADMSADWWRRNGRPSARVLPVVRYELDREEERLRDAVVEAAIEVEKVRHMQALFRADFDDGVKADLELEFATSALRAHLEKKP